MFASTHARTQTHTHTKTSDSSGEKDEKISRDGRRKPAAVH